MNSNLTVVNGHLKFEKVALIKTAKSHYLHIALEIDHSFLPFFIMTSKKKKAVIDEAKTWCKTLQEEKDIISAVVFKAILVPPGKGKFLKERPEKVQVARYDLVILIEANSKEKIDEILSSVAYQQMISSMKNKAKLTHIISATNVRHINPVNHKVQGVFLFNYFFADHLQQNLKVWEYTAGWFQQETGLDNSTVLLPDNLAESKYTIINHCRWDKMGDILPSLLFKKSFQNYVLDNFYANRVAAMPVLYKMI